MKCPLLCTDWSVERCLLDRVELIAIFGPECDELEESVDWIVVGEGADPDRFVVTSSHPGESFEEVMEFALSWTCSREGGVQVIRL